jgi:AcrR family transcriptional regulator
MQNRRERLREATTQEIKEVARRQMYESGGAGAISLRGIATGMGITAPAIYRYFPSRDDLITALIVDAYTALGDAIEAAAEVPAGMGLGDRFYRASLAYRAWALAYPGDFDLVFGQPLPGYKAPPEVTVPLVQRAFAPFLDTLQQAQVSGQLKLPAVYSAPPAPLQDGLAGWLANFGGALSLPVLYFGLAKWAQMHGLVVLELNGQFGPLGAPGISGLYEAEMRHFLADIGLPLTF